MTRHGKPKHIGSSLDLLSTLVSLGKTAKMIYDVWGKPMTADEQAAKSVRYTYGALIVPLESGRYGVFTKFHEFIKICSANELPAQIKKAADKGFNMKKQVEYETRYARNFKRSSTPTETIPGTRPSPVSSGSVGAKVVSDLSQLGF